MSVSLYDVSVGRFLQSLGAVSGYLDKGRSHCEENNIDLNEIVETRLYPDMLPFRFQLIQVAATPWVRSTARRQGNICRGQLRRILTTRHCRILLPRAQSGLQQVTPEVVNGLVGKEVVTPWWSFTAEGFLMSFSLPSFYFHVTTAYDILRTKGVPVGKMDFLGQLNIKT